MKLHNDNFFSVKITVLNVTLVHMGMHNVGTYKFPHAVSLGMRTTKVVSLIEFTVS